MIPQMHDALKDWGDWLRMRSGRPLGSSLTTTYGPAGGHGKGLVIIRNPKAEQLDLFICEMGRDMGSTYKRMVIDRYAHRLTDQQIAKDHRVSRATLKNRMHAAHAYLFGRMQSYGYDLTG